MLTLDKRQADSQPKFGLLNLARLPTQLSSQRSEIDFRHNTTQEVALLAHVTSTCPLLNEARDSPPRRNLRASVQRQKYHIAVATAAAAAATTTEHTEPEPCGRPSQSCGQRILAADTSYSIHTHKPSTWPKVVTVVTILVGTGRW